MKDAYYFSHDSNARNDPKILALRSVYGMAGVGRYWCIIEILREQDGYKLDVTKKHVYLALAKDLDCSPEEAQRFIHDCIEEFELLQTDGEYIWSNSLIRRMEKLDMRRESARKAAQERWDDDNMPMQCERNTDAMPMQCERNANAMQMQCERNANAMQSKLNKSKLNKSKVKESKESKESKENKTAYAEFVHLTPAEHQKLVEQYGEGGTQRLIEILDNYKGASGKTYKSDYRAILNWVVQRLQEEQQRGKVVHLQGNKDSPNRKIPRAFESLINFAKGDDGDEGYTSATDIQADCDSGGQFSKPP